MRSRFLTTALVLLGASLSAQAAPAPAPGSQSPNVGDVPPDFTLTGATRFGVLNRPVHLADLKGETVVLAFFPKARSSGCTIQMKSYREKYAQLFHDGRHVTLIALSNDPADTLAAWAHDEDFNWVFLSDTGAAVGKKYGAYLSRWNLDNRYLFIVGPDGKVVFRQTPFLETDPTAYTSLAAALDKSAPADPHANDGAVKE